MLKVVLAQPRGFCAGVDRAIEIVERALAKFGAPIPAGAEVVDSIDKPKTKAKVSVGTLFHADYRMDTVGLWGTMF